MTALGAERLGAYVKLATPVTEEVPACSGRPKALSTPTLDVTEDNQLLCAGNVLSSRLVNDIQKRFCFLGISHSPKILQTALRASSSGAYCRRPVAPWVTGIRWPTQLTRWLACGSG
ncbi:hypothetical protein ACIQC9_02995 [Brevundimonas sp. NPDC092305]|uniref:hypothetical protein n=1 Tax=Brevundimonas sp. NPDC092305 TaxID=3363957 RepID=UPI0038137550